MDWLGPGSTQPSPTEYCFQFAELSTNKCTAITDIHQNSREGDSVSVLGKVGNINEISTVRLGKQSLLAEGTIADLTGKITISLSEDNREFKIRSLRTTDYGNTRRGPGSRFTAHAR